LHSSPGDFARDFLRADPYRALYVEIDAMAGLAPSSKALNFLTSHINDLLNKPDGWNNPPSVDTTIPQPAESPVYTLADINDLEKANRSRYRQDNEAVLYLLYINGSYEGDTETLKTLGLAYHGSSLVIFKEAINLLAVLESKRQSLEAITLVHEFGHMLGLVNVGTSMVTPHEDPEHSGHDVNPDCLMYWLNEGTTILESLSNILPEFDQECLDDMAQVAAE
jgi:hypothetical protein